MRGYIRVRKRSLDLLLLGARWGVYAMSRYKTMRATFCKGWKPSEYAMTVGTVEHAIKECAGQLMNETGEVKK